MAEPCAPGTYVDRGEKTPVKKKRDSHAGHFRRLGEVNRGKRSDGRSPFFQTVAYTRRKSVVILRSPSTKSRSLGASPASPALT
jgi:hypothetical protein